MRYKSDIASRLTQRITLESPIYVPDGMGGRVKTWQEENTLWADVKLLTSTAAKERSVDDARHAVTQYRIYIRYYVGLNAEMRLRWGSRILYITGVMPDDDSYALTEIIAQEGGTL